MSRVGLLVLILDLGACSSGVGVPVDISDLGYRACEAYFDCGLGRYCNPDGYCWADCRTSADCGLMGKGSFCSLFGECVDPGGEEVCGSHADCGPGGLCNGRCSSSQAVCGDESECPLEDEGCRGLCARQCRSDTDCEDLAGEMECTPVGLCLLPGWERWISPGELPPVRCRQDSSCKVLGWGHGCDCAMIPDPTNGRPRCVGGAESVCVEMDAPLDLGDGPASSPAHAFRGVWGARVTFAVITLGLPLLPRQTTYASNLYLVRARHTGVNRLEIDDKLCELRMINFSDDADPPSDLIIVTIPLRFFEAVELVGRTVDLPSAGRKDPWDTSRSVEVRGALLPDPDRDPLPSRADYEADPGDPRFWDQDEDGHVGMTTYADGVLRGEVYIVQRIKVALHGSIVTGDHVSGLVDVTTEDAIISSNKTGLIYDIQTFIHPEADRTYFRMQRLGDDASCADLIREASRGDSWLRHTPFLMDVPEPG